MDVSDEEEKEGCAKCVSSELQMKNFCLHHTKTLLFVDAQWTRGAISTSYCTYRFIVSVLFVAWSVADILVEAGRWYKDNYALWLVFATNWSLLFLTVSCMMMAASTAYYFCRQTRHDLFHVTETTPSIGCFLQFQWLVYNIATNCAFVVSISYWGFIVFIDKSEFLRTHMTQLKHTLNTLFVIFDLFINAVPVRIYHFIYPLLIGAIYAAFNAVYFINDGVGPTGKPYAYYVLDWRNPLGSVVTCLLGFIVSILVQLILYGLYRFRVWIHRKVESSSNRMPASDREAFANDLDGGDFDKEEESIFSSQNRRDYKSVNDLELTSDK